MPTESNSGIFILIFCVRLFLQGFLFFLAVGLSVSAFAEQNSLALLVDKGIQPLDGKLYRYYDSDNRLSFDSIRQMAHAGEFEAIERNDGLGYVSGTVWLYFRIERKPSVPPVWWLEVRRPALDVVDLYSQSATGWIIQEQGDTRSWRDREVINRNSVFVLDIAPGISEYFVRIQTTSSTAARLTLWQPAAFASYAAKDVLLIGGFAVTVFVVFLINLIMASALRERLYLIYALNLLSLAALLLPIEGLMHFLVAPSEPLLLERWVSVVHPLVLFATGFLFREVVRLREQLPEVDRWFVPALFGTAGLALLAVPIGLDPVLKPWLWKLFLLEMLVNLGLAFWLAYRGDRSAKFYLLAFGVLLFGGVFSILANLGWLPDLAYGQVLPLAGSLLHMVLMQMTVNERVLSIKRAYDEVRELALLSERRAAEGLSAEVAKRTQALEKALECEKVAYDQQRLFVDLVSHEFRTPLAVIDASALSISMMERLPDEALARCKNVREATRQLVNLLEKSLVDSQLDMGNLPLRRLPVVLTDLLATLRGQLLFEAPERVVSFTCSVPTTEILGDPVLLQILFGNLLTTTLQRSVADSEIRVAFMSEDGGVTVNFKYLSAQPEVALPESSRCDGQESLFPGPGFELAKKIAALHHGLISFSTNAEKINTVTVFVPSVT